MKRSSVRLEDSSAESAHNCLPRFPVERNETKPRSCDHIGDTCAAATPRAAAGHRLAPLHLPRLIHQKTEANHIK